MDYYCNKHMPMVREKLGDACKGIVVEAGICGRSSAIPAPYVAIGRMHFESIEAFRAAMAPHVEVILADVANYTAIQPIVQIGDIRTV
jgi:uncharacterized protein (TIGR02118 family)